MNVQIGDRVRYWTTMTGWNGALGTVEQVREHLGAAYAVIVPDDGSPRKYLYERAVEGFEPVNAATDTEHDHA